MYLVGGLASDHASANLSTPGLLQTAVSEPRKLRRQARVSVPLSLSTVLCDFVVVLIVGGRVVGELKIE